MATGPRNEEELLSTWTCPPFHQNREHLRHTSGCHLLRDGGRRATASCRPRKDFSALLFTFNKLAVLANIHLSSVAKTCHPCIAAVFIASKLLFAAQKTPGRRIASSSWPASSIWFGVNGRDLPCPMRSGWAVLSSGCAAPTSSTSLTIRPRVFALITTQEWVTTQKKRVTTHKERVTTQKERIFAFLIMQKQFSSQLGSHVPWMQPMWSKETNVFADATHLKCTP